MVNSPAFFERHLAAALEAALDDTPVVLVVGPRQAGKRFHRGVVLYTGRETLPFGPDLWGLPMTALWQLGTQPVRKGR